MTRRLKCSNCGGLWVVHCIIHSVPCCPGTCPGRARIEQPAATAGVGPVAAGQGADARFGAPVSDPGVPPAGVRHPDR